MSEYNTLDFRFIHMGLNLRDAVDVLPEGRWQRLVNAEPTQEGTLETRPGRAIFANTANTSFVHTLKHYSSTQLLVGAGTSLYRNTTSLSSAFSGNPLTMVSFLPPEGAFEWFYVGDSSQLRKVSSSAATTTQKWGIVGPAAAPNFVAGSAGGQDSSVFNASVYDYRYTYYNEDTGAESNASPVASGIALTLDRADIDVLASADAQVTHIRIYRRGGVLDVGRSVWRLVLTVANANATEIDAQADSAVALNAKLQEDNYVPFQSVDAAGAAVTVNLPYVWGPFLANYIFATGDAFRPGDLYWTNTGRPDSADIANHVGVSPPGEPLLGGVIYNGTPFAFTTDNLYAIDFGGAAALPTFASRKTPCGRGAVSPWSFCVGPQIYFVNAAGVYQTTGFSEAESLTEEGLRPIFDEVSGPAPNISPIALDATGAPRARLSYGNDRLNFLYLAQDGTQKHFVYHIGYKRWHQEQVTNAGLPPTIDEDNQPRVTYWDENQAKPRLFLGVEDGDVYYADRDLGADGSDEIHVSAQTGVIVLGSPHSMKEWGHLIVDAAGSADTLLTVLGVDVNENPAGALEILILAGDVRAKFPVVMSTTPPAPYFTGLAVRLSWIGVNARVFGMAIQWRPDKHELGRWEFPPTSHGLSGWQQVRDAYICLRSTETSTLTVTTDGVAKTYTIADTNGEKLKVYVPLQPVKGKLWQWSLLSNVSSAVTGAIVPFRLYGEDCELRVKNWNSALGYQLVTPFQ